MATERLSDEVVTECIETPGYVDGKTLAAIAREVRESRALLRRCLLAAKALRVASRGVIGDDLSRDISKHLGEEG